MDVAQPANADYQPPNLQADDPQVREARLVLAHAVHEALARGCALLGITMVGRM
jgi:arginyl-tRNA synthetase